VISSVEITKPNPFVCLRIGLVSNQYAAENFLIRKKTTFDTTLMDTKDREIASRRLYLLVVSEQEKGVFVPLRVRQTFSDTKYSLDVLDFSEQTNLGQKIGSV
jgi:hypothetical protein